MPASSTPHDGPLASLGPGAETRRVHAVFPEDTNHYHTLFGGTAMG